MSLSFTIGGVSFGALGPGNARNALACEAGAPRFGLLRHHVPGVDGNFVTRLGRLGREILCRVRYLGTEAEAQSCHAADLQAWQNCAVLILAPGGVQHPRCALSAARVLAGPSPTGRAPGQCFLDVEYAFHCDA
jgi:hypothetical protein